MIQRPAETTSGHVRLPDQQVRCGVLAQHFPLAALPRMEAARVQQFEGFPRQPGFIVKRGQPDRRIVARQQESPPVCQKLQPDL